MKSPCLLLLVLFALLAFTPSLAAERVWVHCDRSLYAAGETVWLRGWVTDEEGTAPVSKFLYVELLRDGAGSVEQRVKIKSRGGIFFGVMELPKDMDSGWYTLRAYTLAQKDWPAEALFHTRLLVRGVGPVPGIYDKASAILENEEDPDVKVNLSMAADGRLSVALTDADGSPVLGNFSLSVTNSRYADFDFQSKPEAVVAVPELPEGEREYAQEVEFRVKSIRRRLPEQYSVAIMSQDINYYYSQDVEGNRSLKGEEGQHFRIPDLDFPEGTLFSVNVTGAWYVYPASEPEGFAAPFDYGPTWLDREEIRDTARIREYLEGTATPLPADDTLTASSITAERKPAFYRPDRIVGPFSTVFEWRQVQLREDLKKYDDRNLMLHITASYPNFFMLAMEDGNRFGWNLYTKRSASLSQHATINDKGGVEQKSTASFSPVLLYIDGIKREDWTEAYTLSVRDVHNIYVLRGAEAALYQAPAVVLLEMRHYDEREFDEERPGKQQATIGIQPLGWQQPKNFDPTPSANPDRQGTLYWNPCIRTDAVGQAIVALPELPEGGAYLRLEGQTLDGRWFMFSKFSK